jgi:hypothetical protein
MMLGLESRPTLVAAGGAETVAPSRLTGVAAIPPDAVQLPPVLGRVELRSSYLYPPGGK